MKKKKKKKKKNRRKRKTVFSFFTHKRQETRAPIINKGILSRTNSNNDSVNRISKWKQPFSDVCQNVFLEISQYPYENHKSICVRVSLE